MSDLHYRQFRTNKLKLSPAEKAKQLNFFKLVYFIFEKTKPTPEIEVRAIEIQESFFKSNPKRIYTEPILYKEIIKNKTALRFGMSSIERLIMEDKRCSKYGI